jgi:hypothetical protein
VLTRNVQLPLTLLAFTGRNAADGVTLEWITTDEYNVSHFELERSTNGDYYELVASMSATNLPRGGTYRYLDNSPSTHLNFYRLRIVDADASFKLSHIVTVRISPADQIIIFPTIARDQLQVLTEEDAIIRLFTMTGVLLLESHVTNSKVLDISGLEPGTYLIQTDRHEPIRFLKL